jgi:transcriptional regulator with XRE-family HTH domain
LAQRVQPRRRSRLRRPGEVLRELREERGISGRALARDLGLDHKRLVHIENDEEARLTFLEAVELCKALNVSLDDFASAMHSGKIKQPPKRSHRDEARRVSARVRSALDKLDDILKMV